jgi:hypothetical protein
MTRRSPPRKVTYFEPVPPRLARNTIIESTFEVGRRFRCTMHKGAALQGSLPATERHFAKRNPGGGEAGAFAGTSERGKTGSSRRSLTASRNDRPG